VRQLPALTKLELHVQGNRDDPVQWPPFIPPALKALRIDPSSGNTSTNESLMCALPGMLGASGARLEHLEVHTPFKSEYVGEELVHVAQALRCCSATLKEFVYSSGSEDREGANDDKQARMQRLRVQWADVLAGVSACRELQVLVLPVIEVESVFPPGTSFARLSHLSICDFGREPPKAGVVGLWELVASGGLPALAKVFVSLEGRRMGVEEMRSRVAPALEAVAGTLTHLNLQVITPGDGREQNDEAAVEVGHELGLAMGKLWRLKDLALDLDSDGQVYHAMVQGMAASAGGRPLPLLWRVMLRFGIIENPDLLASLLLPSVRVFSSWHFDAEAALLTACALRQAGYTHTWNMLFHNPISEERRREIRRSLRSIASGYYRVTQAAGHDEMLVPSWMDLSTSRRSSMVEEYNGLSSRASPRCVAASVTLIGPWRGP
jgi:hypothetical protein